MTISLLTNPAAMVAQRNLNATNEALGSSLEKLSSGLRVNNAADDVAAMAIGSRLNSELGALNAVSRNASQAVSLLQIAEGALGNIDEMLVRMKSLAIQAGSDTISDTERELLNIEFTELVDEIGRISSDTKFNDTELLSAQQTIQTDTNQPGPVSVNAKVIGDVRGDGNWDLIRINDPGGGGVGAGDDAELTLTIRGPDGTDTVFNATIADADISDADDTVINNQLLTMTSTTSDAVVIVQILEGADLTGSTNAGAVNIDSTNDPTTDFDFRVGTGSVQTEDVISVILNGINNMMLGLSGQDVTSSKDPNINTTDDADFAAAVVDAAMTAVSRERAKVGSIQNRITTAQTSIATNIENTQFAKSAYLDTDIAAEITEFTSQQILLQSGISTLAQANLVPQDLLQLFQQN